MEKKYLPIGTICTLKNNNKKIMIISYFSLEYNGNVKMYDYKGCVYPEGLLLPAQAVSFDHDDIDKVEYMGFKNEQYEIFNNMLNRSDEQEEIEYEQKPFMSNFKFDENGVVVFDGNIQEEQTEVMNNQIPLVSNSNPFMTQTNYASDDETNNSIKTDIFKFNEDGVVISDDSVSENSKPQSRYQFDENGFVIGETNVTEEMPKQESETESTNNFEFDENGTVISDHSVILELKPANMPSYKFDENGTVIEDDTEVNQQPEQLTSNIKFDENGFVISE